MAITLAEDLDAMKAILESDPYLNRAGFNSKNVFRYDMIDEELTTDTQAIFITPSLPDGKSNGETAVMTYLIDVVAAQNKVMLVSNSITQVQALLHKRNIGNLHTLEIIVPAHRVSSPTGTYMLSCSFSFETPVFTEIKT